MVCSISDNNRGAFEKIVPVDIWEKFGSEEYFFLGGYAEESGEKTAVAALVFSVTIGETDIPEFEDGELKAMDIEELAQFFELEELASSIEWLYVDEKYRMKGFATELLDAYFDIIESQQIRTVICDVPEGEDFDALVLTLEKNGLEFTYKEMFRLETTIRDLTLSDRLKALKSMANNVNGIHFLSDLGQGYFHEAIRLIETEAKPEATIHYDFIEDRDGYDLELSCLYMVDNLIKGAFLVRKLPSKRLFPVVLRSFGKYDKKACMLMLLSSLAKAAEIRDENTLVYVDCVNEFGAELVAAILPNATTMLYRRGISLAYLEE